MEDEIREEEADLPCCKELIKGSNHMIDRYQSGI